MKKYKFLTLMACLGMLLLSCVNENKETENADLSGKKHEKKNMSEKLVAALPSTVENTDFIVFSIRDNQIDERQKRSSYDSGDWHGNYLDNLIFQNIKTEETHILTKKKIKIIAYEQLLDSLNPSLNATLYQVLDSFPKNDKLHTFKSLYLSTNDGRNFTKITKVNEHLNSWKYIPETGNIYFTTNDDLDNNRKLNDKDGQSVHSVSLDNFKRKNLLVEELKILN